RTCLWLIFCVCGTAVCRSRSCGRCVWSVFVLSRASASRRSFTPSALRPTRWPSTLTVMCASWSSST
ncbi:hypothetical protein M9458_027616, partial [Cirrhinus mrigala]